MSSEPGPPHTPEGPAHGQLVRALGLRDLVLFNIVAIMSLRWLATSAAAGPSSLVLWVLAALLFFLPMGLAVSTLAVRFPEEGGIYAWTKHTFGETHGFLCGWCYWINNILYYPNLLMSTAVIATYAIGRGGTGLESQLGYVLPATLAMLWFAVLLNIVGLTTGKWLQNVGAVASYLPGALLVALGIAAAFSGPPANRLDATTLIPDLTHLPSLNLWASIAFAFTGIELSASMAGETRDPKRTLPRAVFVATPLIAALYILGTTAVLWLVPTNEINVVSGFLQAMRVGAERIGPGMVTLVSVAALSFVIGNLGGVGAWLSGPARIAFTIGLDRYFPPAFGRIHPRWKTPYVAILVQAALASVFLLLSVLGRGSTVERAYLILLDTMILIYFIPFIYLFLTYIRHERSLRARLTGVSGLSLTVFAMIVACIPPGGTTNVVMFEAKVLGGALLFVLVGVVIYWRATRARALAARAVTSVPGIVLVLGATLLAPRTADAQREPVLKQVRVPHSYYYREMYLPQVTSGPSAASWSPDGTELVYAMQGSLWRQKLGDSVAHQLTDGPGYDSQPDWSPDGRHVAYASYRDDAVELRLVDVSAGTDRALRRDGQVNVEPRWSPDGTRLAFVSTAHEGRFHVFVAPVRGDSLGVAERITEDRDSKLPRYYYSVWDHYLSPSWSPDGRELILVSNRNRIWGTGGFWRMEARAGATMRPLHYEETTWKARPDWSRDGRRVVYSSYAGRQWHQLWLMTSDGGDPFQLTYGEFDATAPRWSRDGARIAFVSNERGNTALYVLSIPGGAREEIRPRRRVHRRPHRWLRVVVTDATTNRAVPARLSITTADGRAWAPDEAWRHADDSFDRRERKFEYAYFHTDGDDSIAVPTGEITVETSRGPEYAVDRRSVRAETGAPGPIVVRVALRRLDDLSARRWVSGDLHVHMNYGGSYRNTPERLAFQARAEDLQVVENLIVNKESRIPDIAYFRAGSGDGTSATRHDGVLVAHDEEFHTSYWGHTAQLGLENHFLLPNYAAYVNTAAASLWPMNVEVLTQARSQGAVSGYVHPFDWFPDPADRGRSLTHELPVSAALGMVDYYETVGFNEDAIATQRVWYSLLNCGFRIAAGAGTDAMANYASLRGPVGVNRVYVKVTGALTHRSFLDGLKSGRTFATNGPLLELTLQGREPGAEITLPAGRHTLRARARMKSFVPVEFVEIIGNGEVIGRVQLSADSMSASGDIEIPVTQSGWYLLRAWRRTARHPVLDYIPIATTSPVYVTVGGQPVRSKKDADYFLAWIARLRESAQAHRDWNTDAERQKVFSILDSARDVFAQRAVH